MKDNIIKDFDQFKEVNESDVTLLGFLTNQAGEQIGKTIRGRATAYLLEFFGVPPLDPNNTQGKGQWIAELFVKVIEEVPNKDLDKFLTGEYSLNKEDYWPEKIAKALKRHIIAQGPHPGQIVDFVGVDPTKFVGRLLTNMYTDFIMDEEQLKQIIIALWRLVTQEEFIPQKDAGEVYKEAYSKLSPEQQKKVEGSVWQSSVQQQDFLKRKRG